MSADIAIVGGGIGGIAAHFALAKVGLASTLYEQAAAFGEVGAGLSLTPNAMKALRWLGLEEAAGRRAAVPVAQLLLHGHTGERLAAFDRVGWPQRYGAPLLQMHRADLMQLLLAKVARGACRTDHRLGALERDGAGWRLFFAGRAPVHADVVIGADGLRSVVRAALAGDGDAAFTGHVAWRALVPAARLGPVFVRPESRNHVGRGRNFVTYPLRGGTLVNMVALSRAAREEAESWTAAAPVKALRAVFADFAPEVQEAVAAIAEGDLYRWGLFARTPLARWTKGSAALLGDAAHPMLPYLGQGAACALEDAVVLGRAFAAAGEAEAALRLYTDTRRARAAALQNESNAGGERLQSLDPEALRALGSHDGDADHIYAYDPGAAALG